jgi:hypothetical protein
MDDKKEGTLESFRRVLKTPGKPLGKEFAVKATASLGYKMEDAPEGAEKTARLIGEFLGGVLTKYAPGPMALLFINDAHEKGKIDGRKENARNAVIKRHTGRNGSNEKRDQILALWASGKFKTKLACAEAASKELHVSLETARKHLRNR